MFWPVLELRGGPGGGGLAPQLVLQAPLVVADNEGLGRPVFTGLPTYLFLKASVTHTGVEKLMSVTDN